MGTDEKIREQILAIQDKIIELSGAHEFYAEKQKIPTEQPNLAERKQ